MYDAIMKAADQIQHFPKLFDFGSTERPDCGTPGCALGWVATFLGLKKVWWDTEVFYKLLGIDKGGMTGNGGDDEFYARMDAFSGSAGWRFDANTCAATLRLYAEKYHAKPKVRTDVHPYVQKLLEHQPEIHTPV